MEIKSISELNKFSLFIFDLDNTIYCEDDYLFMAYDEIAREFSRAVPGLPKKEFSRILRNIYQAQGREMLFDKFLTEIGVDRGLIPKCLDILRHFKPEKKMMMYHGVKKVLHHLSELQKPVFVLTNGNPDQQKNKVNNIDWEGLEKRISFIYANEIEPKPSPKGVFHILSITGISKDEAILIGDSETDYNCAMNSGISFLYASELPVI